MKCCPHIEVLYKKKNPTNQQEAAGQESPTFEHLEKLFRLVIELNHFGKTVSASEDEVSSGKAARLKCSNCEQFSRLFVCAHCMTVYCAVHNEQHVRLKSHPLSVEISYAAIYCHLCKDFQYNRLIEEFVRELFLKEGFFPFGNLTTPNCTFIFSQTH